MKKNIGIFLLLSFIITGCTELNALNSSLQKIHESISSVTASGSGRQRVTLPAGKVGQFINPVIDMENDNLYGKYINKTKHLQEIDVKFKVTNGKKEQVAIFSFSAMPNETVNLADAIVTTNLTLIKSNEILKGKSMRNIRIVPNSTEVNIYGGPHNLLIYSSK